MTDIVDPATRSRMMAGIRSKDTRPEQAVRRGLFALGFRFRLHRKDLPGTPDLVFPKYRAAIFVHGCFWHGHDCPRFKEPPYESWRSKIRINRLNDTKAVTALRAAGWRVATIWECAINRRHQVIDEMTATKLAKWLQGKHTMLDLRGKVKKR